MANNIFKLIENIPHFVIRYNVWIKGRADTSNETMVCLKTLDYIKNRKNLPVFAKQDMTQDVVGLVLNTQQRLNFAEIKFNYKEKQIDKHGTIYEQKNQDFKTYYNNSKV